MKHEFDVDISIRVPKAVAWATLADYGNVHKYVSGVVDTHMTTEQSTDVGAIRHCDLPSMMLMKQYIVEEITEWKEGESFTYKVVDTAAPIADGWVTWWVAGDETRSTISVRVSYRSKGLRGLLMGPMLKRQFPKQLKSALADLKDYLESTYPKVVRAA